MKARRVPHETIGVRCPNKGHEYGIRFDGETPEGGKRYFCTTCRSGCAWHDYSGHVVIQPLNGAYA